MFSAHWFGTMKYDVDGDGEFDAMDVQKWLNMPAHERTRFMKNQFRRAPVPGAKYLKKREEQREKIAGKGGGKGIGRERSEDDDMPDFDDGPDAAGRWSEEVVAE